MKSLSIGGKCFDQGPYSGAWESTPLAEWSSDRQSESCQGESPVSTFTQTAMFRMFRPPSPRISPTALTLTTAPDAPTSESPLRHGGERQQDWAPPTPLYSKRFSTVAGDSDDIDTPLSSFPKLRESGFLAGSSLAHRWLKYL
jgi:hypothetical protein